MEEICKVMNIGLDWRWEGRYVRYGVKERKKW